MQFPKSPRSIAPNLPCCRLQRSKSTCSITTSLLNSVRKVDKRVKQLSKKLSKVGCLKSSGMSYNNPVRWKVDQLLKKCRTKQEIDQEKLLYDMKEKVVRLERELREKQDKIVRTEAQLQCELKLKEMYQYERDRQGEVVNRMKQANHQEVEILNKQIVSLKKEKAKKDQEMIKLKGEFGVLKAEVFKLTQMVRAQ